MTTVPAYYFKQHYQSDYNYRLLLRESFPQYTKYIDAIIDTNDPIQIFKVKTTLNEGTENFLSSIFYVIEKAKYNDRNITRKDIVNFLKEVGYIEYETIYNDFLHNSFLQLANNSKNSNNLSKESIKKKLTMEYFFDLIGQKEAADKIRQANKSYLEIIEEREQEKMNKKKKEENEINDNSNVTVDEFLLLCEKIITSKMLNEKEFVEKIQKYLQEQIQNNSNQSSLINVCGYDIVRKIYNLPLYNYVEENKKITERIIEHQNSDIDELNKKNKKKKNVDVFEDKNSELMYLNEELSMLLQRKKDIELDIKETGDAAYYAEDMKNLNEDIRKVKKEIWDKNNYTAKITYSALGVSIVTGIILYFCNRK